MQLYQYSPNNFVEKCVLDHMLGEITDLEAADNFDTYDNFAVVREDILAEYISFSNINSKELLPTLIDVLEESSITDKIFDILLTYPNKKVRTAVVISLSHMKLTAPQLLRLCKEELTFECFYSLGELLYHDEKVTNDNFESYLHFFIKSKFGTHVNDFIDSYLTRDINNKKEHIIEKFVQKNC